LGATRGRCSQRRGAAWQVGQPRRWSAEGAETTEDEMDGMDGMDEMDEMDGGAAWTSIEVPKPGLAIRGCRSELAKLLWGCWTGKRLHAC
jgi:hypothetical protein